MASNDAKEWVTVKVPKPVRDDARDDPRTYGEVMRAGLETPAPDADVPEGALVDAVCTALDGIELNGDTEALSHQLDRNYEAIKEATQAAQAAERAAEELSR